ETRSSFTRWTVDLQHEIPLYRRVSSTGPRAFNGPNECAQALGSSGCPPVQWSRNREGLIGFRIFLTGSSVSNGDRPINAQEDRQVGGIRNLAMPRSQLHRHERPDRPATHPAGAVDAFRRWTGLDAGGGPQVPDRLDEFRHRRTGGLRHRLREYASRHLGGPAPGGPLPTRRG